jgi:hypothetical protein
MSGKPERILGRTMTFSIFDSGNLVASYDDERVAMDALSQVVHDDPESADDVVLVRFDDAGEPVGDAVPGSSVRSPQVT